MRNQLLRSASSHSTSLQRPYSLYVTRHRFYSTQLDSRAPDSAQGQRSKSTPDPHNDLTSFVSKFRSSLPPPKPQVDQYRVKDLKLVARSLVPEALDALPPKAYSALTPLPKIPESPPRPEYPAPWIHGFQSDLLVPLYARLWRVYLAPPRAAPQHLYLGKHMFFASPDLAKEFQKHVETFMDKTKHHGHLDRKGSQLFYATNTHSADPKFVRNKSQRKETPGVTALDVRMAIRVEELWDKWLKQGKAMLPPPGTSDSGMEVHNIVGFGLRALRGPNRPFS